MLHVGVILGERVVTCRHDSRERAVTCRHDSGKRYVTCRRDSGGKRCYM